MKIIFSYLKYRLKGISVFIISALIFFIVFSLYSLPFEPLLYSIALCVTFSLPIIITDFISFRKKHNELYELKATIGTSLELLPEPKNLYERDYTALINKMFSEKCAADPKRQP